MYSKTKKAPFAHDHSEASISQGEEQINSILASLYHKLDECESSVGQLSAEKEQLIEQLTAIGSRVSSIKSQHSHKQALRNQYEHALREGEGALRKITESTKTLMLVINKEKNELNRRSQ